MKVGISLDARNPPLWHQPWSDLYASLLEGCEQAENLGIDSVWLTEHHFFEDGYLPQTLTLAAAIAARTARIRIGTAILIPGLRSALEVAEQAAIVDLVSDGRLELGLGAGYRVPEFEAFGQDIRRRYELLEERAVEIKRLWEGGGFTPPPVQANAPLWIGAHGPRGARLAGKLGAGLMSFSPRVLEPYQAALERAGHGAAMARLTHVANMIIADDPEAAWHRIAPHLAYQWSSLARYGAEGAERGGGTQVAAVLQDVPEAVDPDTLRSEGPAMSPPAFDVVTAEEAIRRIRLWLADLPAHTVYFSRSIAGMPADLAERHVELLAAEVAPALRDGIAGSSAAAPER
jgi:alkanesulfonate monooxygenase SsuD/methylene tetrahydromethanopterin reductase-like flavin-dependent oxidoreductase (luciferase family)